MENIEEDVYACPSFNSYSSNRLAEIAVKVAAESSAQDGDNNDDEDFEFSLVREDREVLADEIFYDGQIGPIFPVFNRDLLLNDNGEFSAGIENERLEASITVPLSKLFIENQENREFDNNPPSCSSSEDDESENIPASTYCVWRPKTAANQPSPSRCKKSNSTGSTSKKWTFRDLLRRSNSEGKNSFVFLSPKNREEKLLVEAPKKAKGKRASSSASGSAPSPPSAHEALYTRNRAIKAGDKKKSYLPYRQDLVGFFVNANSFGKSFPRF